MVLRRRLAWLAAGYIALLSVTGVVALLASTARTSAVRVESTLSALTERVLRLQAAYIDMESGERGFVIGGDDVFLEPYRNGESNVERLQPLIADDLERLGPQARASFEEVIIRGAAWRARAAAEVSTRRQDGRAAAERVIATKQGNTEFDSLRSALRELSDQLVSDRTAASARREFHARQLTALVVLSPLLGIAFTGAAAVLVTRWVVHPIRAMVAAVRQVVSGDLTVVVPALGAPDVAELGASVDSLRATIADKLDEAAMARDRADRSREAIEQSTTVVLQLRSELAKELGTFPDGWSAAADLLPAEGYVAGDCYDVTLVSPHQLGVVVIDIAGHGAAQAVAALKSKEILRAALRVAMAPGDALSLLSEQMGDMDGSFLTAFVGLIDTRTGLCRYANAGHPAPLLAYDDDVVDELPPTGPLLGPFAAAWKTAEVMIGPGGKLAVYTDGLSEARDGARQFYGMERLARRVAQLPCERAEAVLEACFRDLRDFSPERLDDDVTMVLVCRDCEEVPEGDIRDDAGLGPCLPDSVGGYGAVA